MTVTSTPRPALLGMEFQYRTFWNEACRLFSERQIVGRVSIERRELRAFDDVVTRYSQPIYDAHNRLIDGDHFQAKFHVDYARAIRGGDLIEPRFIGARRHSLFDRLAQATHGGEIPRRVTLVTPWPIDTGDPLALLVSPRDGEMVLHHLFAPSPSRPMVELRELWRTAPVATCAEGVNPAGHVPRAQNEDGFFLLTATDAVDPDLDLFVIDTGSGTIFGPFPSGTNIKYVQAPGATPSQSPGSGAVDWKLKSTGDAQLVAVDGSGNVSAAVDCLVPRLRSEPMIAEGPPPAGGPSAHARGVTPGTVPRRAEDLRGRSAGHHPSKLSAVIALTT